MAKETQFDDTAAAYQQVQMAVSKLKGEYSSVCAEIAEKWSDLKAAPLAYLPLADLKAGILDFVDASGARYAEDAIKGAVSAFATNFSGGSGMNTEILGKPMRFCDLEAVVTGRNASGGWAQLLTPQKSQFNDQVLYYFFAKLVKQGLAALMDDMPMSAFGYDGIDQDKIGSDRATRRKYIAMLTEQLKVLNDKKGELELKLATLGISGPY